MMKKGLLLINIGTPASPDAKAIRTYLEAFLSDKRVIDLPAPLRYLLLYGFILPFRPKKSSKAYQQIWTDKGSPLLVYSQQLVSAVTETLGQDWKVVLGMRYGKPSLEQAFVQLQDCDEITILPLYPQYASASTGSSLEKVFQILAKQCHIPSIKTITHFYNNKAFIDAWVAKIAPAITEHEHILFSYHGLPERQLKKIGCQTICQESCLLYPDKNAVCYRSQCYETSEQLAQTLGLTPSQYSTAFQSQLGRTPWIQPFTDQLLKDLRLKGIKSLAVACPSFTTDCLETLEEMGIRAKKQWLLAGGTHFTLIPCLNADKAWVDALCSWVTDCMR